ncbi:unnamed protein product [Caenorhabditis brenneri]
MKSSNRSSRLRKRSRKGYRPRLHKSSARTISPSKLWILLFVSLFPSQYLVAAGYVAHEVYKANVYEDPSQMDPMDYARFRRDAAVFSTAVTNLQSLSRIASAITLEIGLMDKTLDSQLVLPELLRMGAVKPSEITSMDPESVKASVSQLVELPNSVAQTKPPNPVEEGLKTLETMRKDAKKFEGFATVPGKAEYEASLKKVKDLDTLETYFGGLEIHFVTVSSQLKLLSENDDLVKNNRRMETILDALNTIETTVKTFQLKQIQEAKDIVKTSKFIDLIIQEQKIRLSINEFKPQDSDIKSFQDNIQKIYQNSEAAKKSANDFDTIRKLMNSRAVSHRQSFQYVSGLPGGSTDLNGLLIDIKSDWIKGRMADSKIVTENLQNSFTHFRSFAEALRRVESDWSPLNPGLNRIKIEEVLKVIGQIANAPGDSQSFTTVTDALLNCRKNVKNWPSSDVDLEKVQKTLNDLNDEVEKVSEFKQISSFADLTEAKKDFDTTNKSDQDKEKLIKDTLKKISSDEKMKKFIQKLNTLHLDLSNFPTINKEIKTKLALIDVSLVKKHVDTVMGSSYINIYGCLDKIQGQNTLVQEVIDAMNSIRKISVSSDTENTITNIAKSGAHLQTAEKEAVEFQKIGDPASTSLKSSGLSIKVSQELGFGVQGLSAIQKVFNAQVGLKKSIEQILKDPKINKLSTEHQKGLEELKKLDKVFTDVDAFMQSFVQASRRKRASGFENAKKIFDDAAKIPGAILDFKTLRPAMEKLQKVKTLDDLEKLDLDFSRFEIAKAGPHLATLDKFFVDYARKIRSATPPPGKTIILPPNSPQNSANALAVTEAKELTGLEKFMADPVMFYGSIFGSVLIIAGIVFVAVCCCRKKKVVTPKPVINTKSKSKSKTDSDESSDDGGKAKGGKKEETKKKKRSANNDEKKDDTSTEGPPTGGVSTPKAPVVEEKKMRSADNDEKKDGTSTEGPSTGGVTTPKAPVVEEKEKSLPLEKTQKSLEDSMLLVRATVGAISGRFDEGVSPSDWAKKIMVGHDTASRQLMTEADTLYKRDQRRYCNQMLVSKTLAKLGPKYKGTDPFININEMPYKDKIVLVGQGPQDGKEYGDKGQLLIDNREKQYHVFDNYNVRVVGQLCQFVEDGCAKCGQYYPLEVNKSEKYGKYEVTTTEIIVDPPQIKNSQGYKPDECVVFKVKYKHDDDKVAKYVDIVTYKGMPDHSVPDNYGSALALIDFLESYDSNIFIHCSAGIGRTGTFAAIMCGIEMCNNQEVESINEIIQHVRSYRGQLIQSPIQVLFIVRVIGEALLRERGVVQYDELSKFEYYYQEVKKKTYAEYDEAVKKERDPKKIVQILKSKYPQFLTHKEDAEKFMIKDRERLKEDKHPVKRGVNTTTEPEKQGNFQDDFIKQQADLYEKACEEGKEKMLVDEAKKEKDLKKSDEKKSGEEVKKVKETKKSEQKNPEEKVKKSGEKDTKKKAASKAPGPSKEKGRASKEKDGAGKKKK